MKKLQSLLCICAMVVGMLPMMALPTSAATYGDFEYTVSNGKVTITKFTDHSASEVWIPSSIGGYPVTAIGAKAFKGRNYLSYVSIPSSVKSIGEQAFSGCSLDDVTIPQGVTVIREETFYACDLETVSIPSSVKTIEDQAFWSCSSLESVIIPSGVTSIGEKAFEYCGELESLTLSKSLKTIGAGAFSSCYDLESVTIPPAVTTIGKEAFAACTSLESLTISTGVKTIGEGAFRGCTSLKSVTIPSSVTTLGAEAFNNCKKLKNVTILSGVKTIGADAFRYCEALEKVTIPFSVTKIANTAFADCASLEAVMLPSSVKSIGSNAFNWCNNLSDVYYFGTKSQWETIDIDYGNRYLVYAQRHYKKKVAITSQPKTAYAKQGAKASTKVSATGDGLTYAWYIKNAGSSKYAKSSVKSTVYSLAMDGKVHGRSVYCVVTDKYGYTAKSNVAVLRRQATIVSAPATVAYAKKGATASVKIGAVGSDLKYTWYTKNSGATKYSKSSVTSSVYTTKMNSQSKDRLVYCVVKDKYGKTAQSKKFLLHEAVSITTQPKTTTVAKGATAKVTVKASGDGLTYAWYIKSAGQTKYTKSSVTKATYSATMNSQSKNRLVYCVVKDKYGKTVKSKTVQLKMK